MPIDLMTVGTRATEDLPHGCGRGESRWSGYNTAHCATCHKTFAGVGAFDYHRNGGACRDPQTAGMHLTDGRAYECWSEPHRDGGLRDDPPTR